MDPGIDPTARFASNLESTSNAALTKKRVYKKGDLEIPGYNTLATLKTSKEQLELCLSLSAYTNLASTVFTSGSKTFAIKKLKPILKCLVECCKSSNMEFVKPYPGKLKLGTFGANKCGHKG